MRFTKNFLTVMRQFYPCGGGTKVKSKRSEVSHAGDGYTTSCDEMGSKICFFHDERNGVII